MISEMTPLMPPSGGEDGNKVHRNKSRRSENNRSRWHRRSRRRAVPVLVAAVIFLIAFLALLPTFHKNTNSLPFDDLDPAKVTFREMARRMLPAAFDEMCKKLPLLQQPHLHPSQVHDTRKTILRTRDLLDVFSPVYSKNRHQDLLLTLRRWTSTLYETVGEFQDLHYAKHASYAIKDYRRQVVQGLVANFSQQQAIRNSHMRAYLARPTNGCYQRKESHLFWPNNTQLPAGSDLAMPSLRALGIQQIHHALYYMNETLSYDGLTNDTVHETFHNFRKEMRSLTDEYDLFSNSSGSIKYVMFPPAASEPTAIPLLKEAHIVLGLLNDDFVGLEIYTQNNESQPLQEEILHQHIREGWESFCTWVEENQLEQSLKDLAALLETDGWQ